MKGLDNSSYLLMWIAFNILAIFFLLAAVKKPKTGRLLYFLLFSWACWMNWSTCWNSPQDYLQYADLALSSWYSEFIRGWFSKHIPLVVGIIATCQGFIALSLVLKGWIYKLGCAGAILFLGAIAPLGIGSGFPCTITFAVGLLVLVPKGNDYWWTKKQVILSHS